MIAPAAAVAGAAGPTLLDLIVGAPPGAPASSSFAALIALQSAPVAAEAPALPILASVAPAPATQPSIEQADALIAQLAGPTSRPDVPAAEPMEPLELTKPLELSKPPKLAEPMEQAEPMKLAEPMEQAEPPEPMKLAGPMKPAEPLEQAEPERGGQAGDGEAPTDAPVTFAGADASPDLPKQVAAPAPTQPQVQPLAATAMPLPSGRVASEPAAKAAQGAVLPARPRAQSNLASPAGDLPVHRDGGDTAATATPPASVFVLAVAPAEPAQTSAPAQPSALAQPPVPDVAGASTPAIAPEVLIEHRLELAQDHVWLDQLARDISRSADANGRLRFALAPEHLGRMTVDLAAGTDGTAVRMTTESEQARRIVSDAQPRLIAEAQAHGLRISETQVLLDQRPGLAHRIDPPFADAAATASGSQGASSQGLSGQGQGGHSAGHQQHSGAHGHQLFAGAQDRPAPKRQTAAPAPTGRHLYA